MKFLVFLLYSTNTYYQMELVHKLLSISLSSVRSLQLHLMGEWKIDQKIFNSSWTLFRFT